MQADKLTSCKLQCIPCKLTSSRLTSRLSWQVVHTTLSLTPRSCSPQWWCHHHGSSAWGPASRTISDTYYIFGNNHCSNQAAVTFWFTYSAKVYVKYWGQNLHLQEAMSRKIWMQLNKSDNKSEWNQVEWSEDESGHKTNHLINHLEWILCLAEPRNCTFEKTMLWMETRFKAWRVVN